MFFLEDFVNYPLEPDLHWTDHFVKHGFAVLRNHLGADFIEAALQRVRALAGVDLPYEQWTTQNVKRGVEASIEPAFVAVYDQPKIREMIATMYGTAEVGAATGWSGHRHSRLFLNPFAAGAKQAHPRAGHVDFGHELIPVLGGGFSFHVILRDTEPFGGNYTIWPGSHKVVQKMVMEKPELYWPDDFRNFKFGEPFEFYGNAGDLIVIHHLAQHTATPCCGDTRKPRIGLHTQVPRTTWLQSVDPEKPNMSPFERSMTLNGKFDAGDNEQIIKTYNENKKMVQGVWASEEGAPLFNVYRYADGAVRVKPAAPEAKTVQTARWRFDGRRLRFEQIFDGPAPEVAKQLFGMAGTHPMQGGRYPTVLELDSSDTNRLTCQITGDGLNQPVTQTLRRIAFAPPR